MSFLQAGFRGKWFFVSAVFFGVLFSVWFSVVSGTAFAQSSSGRFPGTAPESSDAAIPSVRGAQPQTIPDTQGQRLKSLEERLRSLEEEIRLLKEDLRAA